jgi:hypothetical protein
MFQYWQQLRQMPPATSSQRAPAQAHIGPPSPAMRAIAGEYLAPQTKDPSTLQFAKPEEKALENHGFSMPAGESKVIPAHNIAAVDPEMQKKERELASKQGTTTLQLGEQQTKAGLAKAEAQGGVVQAQQHQAADIASQQEAAQAKLQPLIDQRADTMRQRAALHMSNPDKRGTWGRISDAIGAGLSAAGMGLLHQGGPNPVLERIHADIDREVDRQKEDFARKGAQLTDQDNLFAQVYKLTGDARQAKDAVHSALVQASKDHVDEVATRSASPQARLQAQLLKDKIDESDLQRTIQENPRVQAAISGSYAQDLARTRQLRDEAAKVGKDLEPKEAFRQAVIERSGNDTQSGPLGSYAHGTSGSFSPTQVPSLAGASTAYNLGRILAGTGMAPSIDSKVEAQRVYNAEVEGFIKQNLGLRGETAANNAREAFHATRGDTQAALDRKYDAYLEAIVRHPGKAGTGGIESGESGN